MESFLDNQEVVIELLMSAREDLEAAKSHIERHNYGLASSWIDAALKKLPSENEIHRNPWPTEDHIKQVTRWDYKPAFRFLLGRKHG